MPTYEYRCSAGHEFEHFQRMSEEPLRACTICGGPAERLLSAGGGLLFKGSGFYITDYRSDSYRKAAEADAGPKAEAGSKAGEGGSKSGEGSAKSGEASAKSGGGAKSDASSKSGSTGSGGATSSPKDSGGGASSSRDG
jgi:putative FmdB family regulatory protein